MNYKDDILENKTFDFFKQLMYNIALAICIMLVGVLVLTYGFNYKLYEVKSGSQAPYILEGDMVVVKAQKEYKVGDIIKFDESSSKTVPTTHRLIAIMKDSHGVIRYICHGDNVQDLDGTGNDQDYKDEVAFIEKLTNEDKFSYDDIMRDYGILLQAPTFEQIDGEVVNCISNYGTYFKFIKSHYMLLIALIAGIWCVSNVVQNELDIKKCRRLL